MEEPLENDDPYGYVRSARAIANTATTGKGWRRWIAQLVAVVVLAAVTVSLIAGTVSLLTR